MTGAALPRNCHDDLGQALMVLRFQVSTLKSKLPQSRKILVEDCSSILEYLNEVIENVRRLCGT